MIRRRRYHSPHVYTDPYGHRLIDGRTFMGRNRVPPMPSRMALKDRTTGVYKVLSHNGSPGALGFILTDITVQMTDVQRFGPEEGPYDGDYRLYLDNGTLAAEYAPGHSNKQILTRRDFDTTVLRITINQVDATVVYTEVEL